MYEGNKWYPSPDELYHWKYIKRYKNSKGKWTYVYADKNTHNSLKRTANGLNNTAGAEQASARAGEYARRVSALTQAGYKASTATQLAKSDDRFNRVRKYRSDVASNMTNYASGRAARKGAAEKNRQYEQAANRSRAAFDNRLNDNSIGSALKKAGKKMKAKLVRVRKKKSTKKNNSIRGH